MSKAFRLLEEANEILDAAAEANRELTETEYERHVALISQARAAGEHEKALRDIGRQLGSPGSVSADPNVTFGAGAAGPGDLFVKSQGWKSIADPNSRGQTRTTGPVEVSYKAGTLFEGTGGQGAGVIPVPDVHPGVVQKLLEPLGVANVFGQAQTTSSSVRYMLEGTATSAAAGVAEGGVKPASDIAVSTVDEPVKKVATATVP